METRESDECAGAAIVLLDNKSDEIAEAAGITKSRLPWRHAIRQIVASCIAHSIAIHAGINMAFSAILLPQLANEEDVALRPSKDQASWIASVMAIALPLGSLLMGPLMDRFGRKRMAVAACLPFALSWLLHARATTFGQLMGGRIVGGFSGGLSTVGMVYVSEVAHADYRTMLLSLTSVFVSLGILVTCALGLWLPWRHIALVNCASILVSAVLLFYVPESPHWLRVFRGDETGAINALSWLYPNPHVCQRQIDAFQKTPLKTGEKREKVTKNTENDTRNNEKNTALSLVTNLKSPTVYKPFAILTVIFLVQQLTLAYVIIFYAVDLFRRIAAGHDFAGGIDEFVALVILGALRFVMACVTSVISKWVGRRRLFLVSGVGMTLTSFIAGVCMYLMVGVEEVGVTGVPGRGNDTVLSTIDVTGGLDVSMSRRYANIALYSVLGYVVFSSMGYLIIPWTLIGELLPVKVRAKLGAVMFAFAYVLMFLLVKIFPFLLDWMSLQSMFLSMATVNFFGLVFIQWRLPETLGKTFDDIEQYFR